MLSRIAAAVAVLSSAWSASVLAHHSTAVFEQGKKIELRGVVVDFKLRSPHSSMIVDGSAHGDRTSVGVERWEIEWDALPPLRTMGVDADTFKVGDAVTITATPHRDPTFKFAHANTVVAADGRQFGFGSSNRQFSPTLTRNAAGGAAQAPAAPFDKHGIDRFVGRWQQPLTPTGAESVLPLNPAGVAARAAYDRKASPANTCEPMSIPDVFTAPFYLFEVRAENGAVTLHNEAYDITRTVKLDGKPAKVDAKGQFGTASARLDGDTLVIESRDHPVSKWGLGSEVQVLGGGADVPSSPQKTVTEKLSVSPDGKTLAYEFTLQDPTYLTKPYTGRVELTRAPDGTPIYPYACDVESAAMWSRTVKDKPLHVGQ
jgi:hypothetical protein